MSPKLLAPVFFVLLLAIPLVAWSLHLMQVAFDRREFSFMLAGLLVASAAGGLVFVYCLMNSSLGYLITLEEGDYLSYQGPLTASDPVAIAGQDEFYGLMYPSTSAPDLELESGR